MASISPCNNDHHVGPFKYEGESETVGTAYALDTRHFVSLNCESCFATVSEFNVYEVADILNKLKKTL